MFKDYITEFLQTFLVLDLRKMVYIWVACEWKYNVNCLILYIYTREQFEIEEYTAF